MSLIVLLKGLLEGKQAKATLEADWQSRLYTPTVIEQHGDHIFIVDCWHHRVLYSADIKEPIERWSVLTDRVGTPHSIASDGTFFLTEDAVSSKVLVFRRKGGKYTRVQEITEIGSRPHRIIYDSATKYFYGIAAASGEIFVLKNRADRIERAALFQVEPLKNAYTRSLAIIDRKLYTVSGPGKILEINLERLQDGELYIESEYRVPFELWTMNDIIRVGSYYYISSYQNGNGEIAPRFIRVKRLEDLESHSYEDIYGEMGLKGVPYYFSFIGNRIYMTEIDNYSRIISFRLQEDRIVDIQTHFDFGAAVESSRERREQGETQGV